VVTAANGAEALARFREQPIQLVLLDHRMPDMNGDEVLKRMKAIDPLVRCIMITAYGSVQTAVEVMKLGAGDFVEKPVDLKKLLETIRRIEQHVHVAADAEHVNDAARRMELPFAIVAGAPAMQEVLSLVRRVAPTPWPVLISGETGTGKEVVARLIHLMSPRAEAPLVEVNCAAVPENLFESELFGHEKGAFTGAVSSRRGRFEEAQGGTLFLDEVGELSLNMQAKLLRVLQENKITRVGSSRAVEVDVRILTATNRELSAMLSEGTFREDLFYRLNVLTIPLPPLRDRKEDIPELVRLFIERYSPQPLTLDADAMSTLMKYDFPGNVRELEHIIKRLAALSRSTLIKVSDLPEEVRTPKDQPVGFLNERLAQVERDLILEALERNDWVQTRAAEALGISERVLRYKIDKQRIKKR
ncbi:MAG TPA: sigma-54 dependent transcriptional regulator, partial [Deltaproteobacteria bacterium]|nr:sigma-54 dependent transcriptional regulator [Deltaproteobacteria bacterium]